eukprot:5436165-Pyramimonas_sp.AAC.1
MGGPRGPQEAHAIRMTPRARPNGGPKRAPNVRPNGGSERASGGPRDKDDPKSAPNTEGPRGHRTRTQMGGP